VQIDLFRHTRKVQKRVYKVKLTTGHATRTKTIYLKVSFRCLGGYLPVVVMAMSPCTTCNVVRLNDSTSHLTIRRCANIITRTLRYTENITFSSGNRQQFTGTVAVLHEHLIEFFYPFSNSGKKHAYDGKTAINRPARRRILNSTRGSLWRGDDDDGAKRYCWNALA